ncbi:hypothetical protein LZ31DRAFT_606938 [Colletotrichum somersetense]|nr:hypothetical protein LZ31DRAFT_606938 [Colletotrichum somersetense]
MKFLFNRARRECTSDTATVSFFFNARGNHLEKSTYGLYRSILLQLIETYCDLQTVFNDLTLIPLSQTECPPIKTLQELFCAAVMALGGRCLTCFVDALDECDEEQVQEMVAFFEELGKNAVMSGVRLKTCFSSRHYPHIDIRNGLRLVLEDQPGHSQDLERFVQSQLRIAKAPLADKIRTRILDKAGGVFMWVVLVVDLLNKEIRCGRMFAVEKTLQEIPNQLSDLFKEILRRDDDNMDDLLLCIQWILFSERPLSRQEFYFAMLSGLPGYNEVLASSDGFVTAEAIDLFVISSSKGLAEITKSRSQTVQFIHESVKDFLVKDKGFQELWPELGDAFQKLSHERLKFCCLSHISLVVLGQISPTNCDPLPKANSDQARGDRQMASEMFPFLGYATNYVLHHVNLATGALPQLAFLHQFPLQDWVRLSNILGKTRRSTIHSNGISSVYLG